jgi:hypothetical protein
MSYVDTETGEPIDGKAVILKTTDGEELVDPARLFAGSADQKTVQDLVDQVQELTARVEALESAATTPTNPAEQAPADSSGA